MSEQQRGDRHHGASRGSRAPLEHPCTDTSTATQRFFCSGKCWGSGPFVRGSEVRGQRWSCSTGVLHWGEYFHGKQPVTAAGLFDSSGLRLKKTQLQQCSPPLAVSSVSPHPSGVLRSIRADSQVSTPQSNSEWLPLHRHHRRSLRSAQYSACVRVCVCVCACASSHTATMN